MKQSFQVAFPNVIALLITTAVELVLRPLLVDQGFGVWYRCVMIGIVVPIAFLLGFSSTTVIALGVAMSTLAMTPLLPGMALDSGLLLVLGTALVTGVIAARWDNRLVARPTMLSVGAYMMTSVSVSAVSLVHDLGGVVGITSVSCICIFAVAALGSLVARPQRA